MNIDERYKRAMIYTIRNIKDDTLIYVGSTINTLSKRFDSHKRDCKKGYTVSLYNYIENNDWTDWYIEFFEAYSCNNKNELRRREGQVIREIGTINKCIAGRTKKEYREENAEKIKENNKEYYEQNADKIKEQMKEYREQNADKIKKYHEQNADKLKEYAKEYREQNADKIKEQMKEYREQNADKIKEQMKEKVCCNICGAFSNKSNLVRHKKSKKCMSKNSNNTYIHTDIRI